MTFGTFLFSQTSWNSTWSVSITITSVMENGKEDENYLPDLLDKKSGEQIVFDQKVFRCNEAFVKKMNDLISWFQSVDFILKRQEIIITGTEDKLVNIFMMRTNLYCTN